MSGKQDPAQMGSAQDVSFVDPTGAYGAQLGNIGNVNNQLMQGLGQYGTGGAAFDPNAYMNQFMGQSAGLNNMVSGAVAPLQQALNAQAQLSARQGGEAALAAMGPNSRFSGAANAAFGEAYANPFAQAALQTQQNQLGLTGNLWQQAMGGNLQAQAGLQGLYGQGLGLQTQLAGGMGAIYQPQYYVPEKSGPNWGGGLSGAGAGAAGGFSVGGPWGALAGGVLGGLGGLFT